LFNITPKWGFIWFKNDYFIFTYVDDIIPTGPNCAYINSIQLIFSSLLKLKILVHLQYFLELEIVRSNQGLSLSKRKYTLSLLNNIGFLGNKPIILPMNHNLKLSFNDGDPTRIPLYIKELI